MLTKNCDINIVNKNRKELIKGMTSKNMNEHEYDKYINTKRKHMEYILYEEDGWTEDKILAEVQKRSSVKKFVIAKHDKDVSSDTGLPVKVHYHVYLNFGDTTWSIEAVARWFNVDTHLGCHIKSNQLDTLVYYTHRKYPDKHQYPYSDFVTNIKSLSVTLENYLAKQNDKNVYKQLLEDCGNGKITRLNYTQHITVDMYAKHRREFESCWKYYEDSQLDKIKSRSVIYVYGDSGLGKTLNCRLYAENMGLTAYVSSPGKNKFDDYQGQGAIIIDEIRPYKPFDFHDLILVIDPHNSKFFPARFNNRASIGSIYFLTTVLSPQVFFRGFGLDDTEPVKQFYRRIYEFWHITKNEINIFKYINDKLVHVETVPNPVPAYIAAHADDVINLDSRSVFNKINAEISVKKEDL